MLFSSNTKNSFITAISGIPAFSAIPTIFILSLLAACGVATSPSAKPDPAQAGFDLERIGAYEKQIFLKLENADASASGAVLFKIGMPNAAFGASLCPNPIGCVATDPTNIPLSEPSVLDTQKIFQAKAPSTLPEAGVTLTASMLDSSGAVVAKQIFRITPSTVIPTPGASVIPTPGGTTVNPATPVVAGLNWKAVLLAGDDSINAFDNARNKIKSIITGRGVKAENIKELSYKDSGSGILATSHSNLSQAFKSLNVGAGDACFYHMTSHGSEAGFYFSRESALTPSELAKILDATCGERPTVVLVSACHSGIFTDSKEMTTANRVVLAAARADKTSFGCSAEYEYTYWDSCVVETLPVVKSWKQLGNDVLKCIQRKESTSADASDSLPQSFYGGSFSETTAVFSN